MRSYGVVRCSHCSKEIPAGAIVCPFCASRAEEGTAARGGEDVAVPEAPTSAGTAASGAIDEAVTSLEAASSTPSLDDAGLHGRFLPGTTIADRYRVVGLLGRGGMGEVYRADDLKLGQQVALKFLSTELAEDAGHVGRLLDEVRTARKVSHPNVCRVFDVAEANGQHYVSMEYVDGEDLSSLLRRIGRLPQDKALEIARQLCAALDAAHGEGVLHRDLKPANVMLDGRGRVKLTDFGLAAVAEVRAGTPLYMAPEQLAGEEVSVRSDVYSLGLVLHELFTGKRVFEADSLADLSQRHLSAAESLTTTSELDPAVDRVIRRCLEHDPAKRPASALVLAAGLPGADPLAAALAAGETPSPEMVAEAGGEGSLRPAVAIPLLVVGVAAAVGVGVLQARSSLVGQVPFDTPPVVLESRAREIVADLGHTVELSDSASGFTPDLGYVEWLAAEGAPRERLEVLREGRPASILFWWRGSPRTLRPTSRSGPAVGGAISLTNPPRTVPGMISLQLDTLGRLLWLDVVPDRLRAEESEGETTDWAALFAAMELDLATFAPVSPRLTPPHYADEQMAWEGVLPEDPEVSLRIEAAALDGRPISLRTFTPYAPLEPRTATDGDGGGGDGGGGGGGGDGDGGGGLGVLTVFTILVVIVIIGLFVTVIFGALYVARRNVRSGRGDLRGASRLGYAFSLALGLEWLLSGSRLTLGVFDDFTEMLIFVAAVGGLAWALYLAVEPFMRRHAPEALIGWSRLIDGRLLDPLVARDVLVGCAAGAVSRLLDVVPIVADGLGPTTSNYVGLPPPSVMDLIGGLFGGAAQTAVVGLAVAFVFSLLFVALGRRWWGAYALWLVFIASIAFLPGVTVNGVEPAATTLTSICFVAGSALAIVVLFRVGLLAYIVMTTVSWLLATSLPTADLSAWYSGVVVTGGAIFLALLAHGFYRGVAWRGGIAEALAGD